MSSSTPRINRSYLSVILLFLIATLLLSSSVVQAQDPFPTPSPTPDTPDIPSPTPDVPSPTPDVPTPSASQGITVTASGTNPTSTSTAAVPVPIFSSSENCVACQPEYAALSVCMARIPASGNLTLINQVLPFYQCICANNGTEIDALQECSVCFRSTNQQAFLNSAFYNVTNQDVKAMNEVCLETASGTQVPSGSSGRWDMLVSSAVVSAMMLALLPLGGL